MTERRFLLHAGIALCLLGRFEAAQAADDGFNLHLETRHGWDRQGDPALAEYRAQLKGSGEPVPGWRLKAKGTIASERELDPSPYDAAALDELTLAYQAEPCSVRAGVQQVVWGQADRLRVLDVIHPMDLRESYFGDWTNKRLPLAMLNTECVDAAQSLQVLVVPQTRFNRLPSPQGRFAVPGVADQLAAQGVPIQDGAKPRAADPQDWSGGVQWSGRIGDADLTMNAYHGWQPDPALQPDGAAYRREAARFTLWGGSFAVPVGPVVLHGEGAQSRGMAAYTPDTSGRPQFLAVTQSTGLLGLDYQFEPWFLAAQYYERHTRSAEPLLGPQGQRLLTLAARHSLLQDRLHLTAYGAEDLDQRARYLSLELRHEIDAHWQGRLSFEHFSGSTDSFGRFGPQSRAVFGLEFNLN